MKRYCLAKLTGIGVNDAGENYIQTALDKYAPNINPVITTATDPNGGIPTPAWGLAHVAMLDFTAFVTDPDIIVFPDGGLDERLNSMGGLGNTLNASLAAVGLSAAILTATTTLRQLLNAIGGVLSPGFDCNHFDVGDV